MGVMPSDYRAPPTPDGVTVRAAASADLEHLVAVDSVAFASVAEVERAWLEPLVAAASVAVAEGDNGIVGTGYAVVADGRAGRTVYVAGIGVLPQARRRGIGAAVSGWLTEQGWDRGAQLAHLHPDTDAAAAIYRRLGFVEVGGLDIYVDNAP